MVGYIVGFASRRSLCGIGSDCWSYCCVGFASVVFEGFDFFGLHLSERRYFFSVDGLCREGAGYACRCEAVSVGEDS